VEKSPYRIWKAIHDSYGPDLFLLIIEKEYGGRFAKDYKAMNAEIDKIKKEAEY